MMSMTNMNRTLLLTCVLGLVSATAGAAVSDVVSETDEIIFGAVTPKVTLAVKGYKALPAGPVKHNTQLGEWEVKTLGQDPALLAVSFGSNHLPVAGVGDEVVSAILTAENGNAMDVTLNERAGTTVNTQTEQGAKWLVSTDETNTLDGTICLHKDQTVEANAYSFTMNAAIFNS